MTVLWYYPVLWNLDSVMVLTYDIVVTSAKGTQDKFKLAKGPKAGPKGRIWGPESPLDFLWRI